MPGNIPMPNGRGPTLDADAVNISELCKLDAMESDDDAMIKGYT